MTTLIEKLRAFRSVYSIPENLRTIDEAIEAVAEHDKLRADIETLRLELDTRIAERKVADTVDAAVKQDMDDAERGYPNDVYGRRLSLEARVARLERRVFQRNVT
jgi:hypothetical protein